MVRQPPEAVATPVCLRAFLAAGRAEDHDGLRVPGSWVPFPIRLAALLRAELQPEE